MFALGTQARVEAENDYLNEKLRIDNEITQNEIDVSKKLEDLEAQKVATRLQTLDRVSQIAGAENKIGRVALVLKQALIAKELVMELRKTIAFSTQAAARSAVAVAEGTAQTAKVGFPQNVPLLFGYAAQAVGIFSAIKSATQQAGGSAGIKRATSTRRN